MDETTQQPVDREAIRAARQARADRKAAKLEAWASKRRTDVDAMQARHSPYTSDHAFLTQPGHIPARARIIKQQARAFESLSIADEMAGRASRLRSGVRVAGDAEIAREAKREAARQWVRVGMDVRTHVFGVRRVLKVNRKTVTVEGGLCSLTVDLEFIRAVSL